MKEKSKMSLQQRKSCCWRSSLGLSRSHAHEEGKAKVGGRYISAPEQTCYMDTQQKSSISSEVSTILCEESRMSDPLTHFCLIDGVTSRRGGVRSVQNTACPQSSLIFFFVCFLPLFWILRLFLPLPQRFGIICAFLTYCYIWALYIMRLLSLYLLENTFLSEIVISNSIRRLFARCFRWIWTNCKAV